MAEKTKPIPVIDDSMLVELFTKTGEQMQVDDVELAAQESALSKQIAQVREKRAKHSLSLRSLAYVDDIHNGVALTVRPMVLDLIKFLSDPHSAFSRYIVPKRYEDEVKKGQEVSLQSRIDGKDKPTVQPLEQARVIAIFSLNSCYVCLDRKFYATS